MPEEPNKEGKNKYNAEVKQLGAGEVEIVAEIPADELESYRKNAVKKLSENVEISGFRKGHVPENVLLQKVGEEAILREMGQDAISKAYPEIVRQQSIDAIGRPEIAVTKLARGNPLGFTAKTAVMPTFDLPDSKKIADSVPLEPPEDVSDEELKKTIDEIRKNFAQRKKKEDTAKGENQDKKEGALVGPDGQPISSRNTEEKNGTLPELTDDFVKQLGKFESVDDFKKKMRENLCEEKKIKAKEKRRMAIVEKILEKTDITIPKVLIDAEIEQMLAQFKGQISMAGMKPEDYFKQLKKSEDEIKEGWRADAEKRVKMHLVINAVADSENLYPSEEEIKRGVSDLEKYYQGQNIDSDRAIAHVRNLLTIERVFKFLEGSTGDTGETPEGNR